MAGGFGALAAAIGRSAGQQMAAPSAVGRFVGQTFSAPAAAGNVVGRSAMDVPAPAPAAGAAVGQALAQPAQAAPAGSVGALAGNWMPDPMGAATGQRFAGDALGRLVAAIVNSLPLAPEVYQQLIGPNAARHQLIPTNPFDLPPAPIPPIPPLDIGPQGGFINPPTGPDRMGTTPDMEGMSQLPIPRQFGRPGYLKHV